MYAIALRWPKTKSGIGQKAVLGIDNIRYNFPTSTIRGMHSCELASVLTIGNVWLQGKVIP